MSQRRTEDAGWRPSSGDRWSAADGEAMLAALSASGESDAAFARRIGVGAHRIQYWRKKLSAGSDAARCGERAGTGTQTVAGFVPVRVVAGSPASTSPRPGQVVATLRSGTRLVFSGEWDREGLLPWLAALEGRDAQ